MKKQNTIRRGNNMTIFLFVAIITSCNKEKTVDTNSPAHKIAASEKLTIPAAVELPANLPAGNSRVATYFAEGVQKYKAQLKPGSTNEYVWVLIAPDAKLYDASNKLKGTHGAGPHWVLTVSDSIFAQHFAPAKTAPSPDANSVDWLLLMPKNGKTPTGFFKDVAYIQRIATTGGKAPVTAPANENSVANIPYTAVYRFSKRNL